MDRPSFQRDIEDYLPRIRRIVIRIAKNQNVVDDIVQECCIRIIEKEHLWDEKKGQFHEWLNKVVRNWTINWLKKDRKHQKADTDAEYQFTEDVPLESLLSEERVGWLLSQLKSLPPRQRQVLHLKYVDGMRPIQIAEKLQLSKQSVNSHSTLGLKALQSRARRQGLMAWLLPWTWDLKAAWCRLQLWWAEKRPWWLAPTVVCSSLLMMTVIPNWLEPDRSSQSSLPELQEKTKTTANPSSFDEQPAQQAQAHRETKRANRNPSGAFKAQDLARVLGSTSEQSGETLFVLSDEIIAHAGKDQFLTTGEKAELEVQLDGTASVFPEEAEISAIWFSGEVLAEGLKASTVLGAGVHDITLVLKDDQDPPGVAFDNTVVVVQSESDLNVPPVADAGPDISVDSPDQSQVTVLLDGSDSFDPDGKGLARFDWLWKTKEGLELLSSSDQPQVEVSLPAGQHTMMLVVHDLGEPVKMGFDEKLITVLGRQNNPPVAMAGEDQVVRSDQSGQAMIVLDGSASFDPDSSDHIRSFQWFQLSTDKLEPLEKQSQMRLRMKNGHHTFLLRVSDTQGLDSEDTVRVHVFPEHNDPPVAKAGDNQLLSVPADEKRMVQLDASGSYDDNGDLIILYEWWLEKGEDWHLVSRSTKAQAQTQLGIGHYLFKLKVQDNGEGQLWGTDTMSVTIYPEGNNPPVALAGEDLSVEAGAEDIAQVPLDASLSYDPDGDLIALYEWILGNQVLYSGSAPTVDVPLAPGEYDITLRIRDNAVVPLEDYDQVLVEVLSGTNQAPVAAAGPDQTVEADTLGNALVILDGSVSYDPDQDEIALYEWQWILPDSTRYELASGPAPIAEVSLPVGEHDIELIVIDDHPEALEGRDRLQVTVTPPGNQHPVAVAGDDRLVKEDGSDTATVILDGSDSYDPDDDQIILYEWARITDLGREVLQSGEDPQFEVTLPVGRTELELLVQDDGYGNLEDTDSVVVTVEKDIIHLSDTFSRANSDILGNGWQESEQVSPDEVQLRSFQGVLANPDHTFSNKVSQDYSQASEDDTALVASLSMHFEPLGGYNGQGGIGTIALYNQFAIPRNEVTLSLDVDGNFSLGYYNQGASNSDTVNNLFSDVLANTYEVELKAVPGGYEGRAWRQGLGRPEQAQVKIDVGSMVDGQAFETVFKDNDGDFFALLELRIDDVVVKTVLDE